MCHNSVIWWLLRMHELVKKGKKDKGRKIMAIIYCNVALNYLVVFENKKRKKKKPRARPAPSRLFSDF